MCNEVYKCKVKNEIEVRKWNHIKGEQMNK